MERTEIIDFLRENLSIEITMDDNYEGGNRYVSSTVILSLCGEEISSDYDSVCVETD